MEQRKMPPGVRLYDEVHAPLNDVQAVAEADRCLFCYDAPCTSACPTSIDVPQFIRKIASGNPKGAAQTILEANVLGGTCARACPTEVLCEGSCVLNRKHESPVSIGQLQRFAVDHLVLAEEEPYAFSRQGSSSLRVAIVGAGPAGLACAHKLSSLGHEVTILDRNDKPGGLNEFGLAAYKMVEDFAQREVEYLLKLGGIEIRGGVTVGEDLPFQSVVEGFDAVFVSVGLPSVRRLGIPGETLDGVEDAIDFIRRIREGEALDELRSVRNVVVIGGGNTAIDAAVQAKRLGAVQVDLLYRRGPDQMGATAWEQDLAATEGVFIHHWVRPRAFLGGESVASVETSRTDSDHSSEFDNTTYPADRVLCAIGQLPDDAFLNGFKCTGNKIAVTDSFETNVPGVFAGGDCIDRDEDLTVHAVQHGKLAAESIHRYLTGTQNG